MADKFQLVEADFGSDVNADMEWFVEQHLQSLIEAHRDLHKNKLPKWRRQYLGRPAEETRNFPFPNAANTVVQITGETVDTMVARVMGLIWATHPLWPFKNFAKADSDEQRRQFEEERRTLEDFMDVVGVEPSELNLQEVEALWYTEAANLGTAFVKPILEDNVEAVVVGYTDSKSKMRGTDTTIYSGPRVVNLRHEDVLADPKVNSLDLSDLVAVRHTLTRPKLEERAFTGAYSKKGVETILSRPDRSAPIEEKRQELSEQGIASPNRPDTTAEWDIWECYFPWLHKGRKYRIILSYHRASKTVLRRVFNFLPDNELPVKRAKLGYRTHGLYGHGYAELLEIYQEELSTIHNQRLDNSTVANIRALRISPRARALDSNAELYPAALLIGEKDEIESIQVGDVYPSTFKNEEMTLSLVARRAGISPAISGAGAGGMMKGRGGASYSAQGTMAVMQENNSVVGFATSEFRHAHVQLGASLVKLYGKFGTDNREAMFGLNSENLLAALEKFRSERLRIPIRASTGALNREVEKQTGMLLAGTLQRHYTAVSQLLQAINSPMAPPEFKEYATSVIMASEQLHRKIVKDFGYDQPDLFVPEAHPKKASQPQNQGVGGQGGMAPGGPPMAGAGPPPQGGAGAPLPGGGMGGPPGGLGPLA